VFKKTTDPRKQAMKGFLMWTLFVCASCATALSPPPVGASYQWTLTYPVIGHQTVSLRIATRTTASIDMEGIITHRERLDYSMHPTTNHVQFELSEALVRRMHRYRCRIQAAWYDAESDEACITLRIDMLRVHKSVCMPRVPSPTQTVRKKLVDARTNLQMKLRAFMERRPSSSADECSF